MTARRETGINHDAMQVIKGATYNASIITQYLKLALGVPKGPQRKVDYNLGLVQLKQVVGANIQVVPVISNCLFMPSSKLLMGTESLVSDLKCFAGDNTAIAQRAELFEPLLG